MPDHDETTIEAAAAELAEEFGEPPVLSTENRAAYDRMVRALLREIRPEDFFERRLVRELADSTWLMSRYKRHQTQVIDRKFQEQVQAKARRKLAAAKLIQDAPPARRTELDRHLEYEYLQDGLPEAVDEILDARASELDHARSLEKGIDYSQRLGSLAREQRDIFNDAVLILDAYRNGLGQRLKRISEKVIDIDGIEVKEMAHVPQSPSLEPPET